MFSRKKRSEPANKPQIAGHKMSGGRELAIYVCDELTFNHVFTEDPGFFGFGRDAAVVKYGNFVKCCFTAEMGFRNFYDKDPFWSKFREEFSDKKSVKCDVELYQGEPNELQCGFGRVADLYVQRRYQIGIYLPEQTVLRMKEAYTSSCLLKRHFFFLTLFIDKPTDQKDVFRVVAVEFGDIGLNER